MNYITRKYRRSARRSRCLLVDAAATKKLMALQTEVVVTRVGVPVTRWRCWADSRQSDYEPINFCLEKYYKIFFCNIYRVDLLVLGDRSPRGGYRHPGRIRILPEHSQVGLFNTLTKSCDFFRRLI